MQKRSIKLLLSLSFTGFVLSLVFMCFSGWNKETYKFLASACFSLVFAYWHRHNVLKHIAMQPSIEIDEKENNQNSYSVSDLPGSNLWIGNGEKNSDRVILLTPVTAIYENPLYYVPIFSTLEDGTLIPEKAHREDVLRPVNSALMYFEHRLGKTINEGILPYHVVLTAIDNLKRTDKKAFRESIHLLELAEITLREETFSYYNGGK